MTEWFTPETARWFSFLSLLSLAALTAPWVHQGRHKTFVMSLYFASIALGALLLAVAGIASLAGQPAWVVRPLLLSGVVIAAVFAGTLGNVRASYTKAEERRMLARDL